MSNVAPRPPFLQVLRFASSSTEDSGSAPVLGKNTLSFAALEEAVQGYLGLGGKKEEIGMVETKALGSKN